MGSRVVRVAAAFAFVLWAFGAPAQDAEQVASPYQGEYPYTIGSDLTPNVSVDGVHIDVIRVAPSDGEAVEADREADITVTATFTNNGPKTARAMVVLLLEDAQGNALDRLQMPSVRVPSGKTRSGDERFTVRGRSIQETQKVYLFCELE